MNISDMIGRTMVRVTPIKDEEEEIIFVSQDGLQFKFYHDQDCCESVYVNDVCGNVSDLIGSPILQAEEASSSDSPTTDPFTGQACAVDTDYDESHTWTFYKFATIKGSVTVRWLGQSNGYYSESVSLVVTPVE